MVSAILWALAGFILRGDYMKSKITKQVQDLYSEIQDTHLKLIKLNQVKRFEADYFIEICDLEEKQKLINNQLKQLGWIFDYETFNLVGLNE